MGKRKGRNGRTKGETKGMKGERREGGREG